MTAERASEALERLVRERGAPALIVVAPPRTLADLRARPGRRWNLAPLSAARERRAPVGP